MENFQETTTNLKLEHDHPLHAYLDDSIALLDVVSKDPSLLNCEELVFLKKFFFQNKDKFVSNPVDEDEEESGSKVNDRNRDVDLLSKDTEEDDDEKCPADSYWKNDYNSYCYCGDIADIFSEQRGGLEKNDAQPYGVVVVGAGAAGIGIAVSLLLGGLRRSDLIVLESSSVGSSFKNWSNSTRFISPSFYSNPFGPVDLNAIDPTMMSLPPSTVGTSEYLNGSEYARYLRNVAKQWNIPIREKCRVAQIQKLQRNGDDYEKFYIDVKGVTSEVIQSRFVIWCGGEWNHPQYPSGISLSSSQTNALDKEVDHEKEKDAMWNIRSHTFEEGSFVHYSDVGRDWNTFVANNNFVSKNYVNGEKGRDATAIIVGGSEAGVDAACALMDLGFKKIHIIDKNNFCDDEDANKSYDPSLKITNVSRQRFRESQKKHKSCCITRWPHFICTGAKTTILADDSFSYVAYIHENSISANKRHTLEATGPILLCTGFNPYFGGISKNSPNIIHSLFDANPSLKVSRECDESTKVPGIFLCGPMLRHTIAIKEKSQRNGNWHESYLGQQIQKKDGMEGKNAYEKMHILSQQSAVKELKKEIIFCFIYKFRTRFAVVASEIISRLIYQDHVRLNEGKLSDDDGTEDFAVIIDQVGHQRLERVENMMRVYKDHGMYLSDLDNDDHLSCVNGAGCMLSNKKKGMR